MISFRLRLMTCLRLLLVRVVVLRVLLLLRRVVVVLLRRRRLPRRFLRLARRRLSMFCAIGSVRVGFWIVLAFVRVLMLLAPTIGLLAWTRMQAPTRYCLSSLITRVWQGRLCFGERYPPSAPCLQSLYADGCFYGCPSGYYGAYECRHVGGRP